LFQKALEYFPFNGPTPIDWKPGKRPHLLFPDGILRFSNNLQKPLDYVKSAHLAKYSFHVMAVLKHNGKLLFCSNYDEGKVEIYCRTNYMMSLYTGIVEQTQQVKSICTTWNAKAATSRAFAVLKQDNNVVTWGRDDIGGNSSSVRNQLRQVESIYGGARAFAALKQDKTVVTWGEAYYGGDSSSVRDQLEQVKSIYGAEYAFAAALKYDDTVVT